jgi:hypothetical protein
MENEWNHKKPLIARIRTDSTDIFSFIRAIRVLSASSAVNREWNHKKPRIARMSTDCADISFNYLCHPRPIRAICGEPRMEPQGSANGTIWRRE